MTAPFTSHGDLAAKPITFERLSVQVRTFNAEGDPSPGVVIGDDSVMVVDAQATPAMAQEVIRQVTDKPIRHVRLSRCHAVRVRVLGTSAYGAQEVIASRSMRNMIIKRGEADWKSKSEHERFPHLLFQAAKSIPAPTWPTLTSERGRAMWIEVAA